MTATTRSLPAQARVWLGWALAVATVVFCGAGSNFGHLASAYLPVREQATQRYFALTPIFAIAFGVVGALIVWRRPRNRIGWVCCGIGILWGAEQLALGLYVYSAYFPHPVISATPVLEWLVSWVWIPPVVLTFFFLPFLFPDGQPVSPRWRPVAGVALAGVAAAVVGTMAGLPVLALAGHFINIVCAILAAATLVIRYHLAGPAERKQIQWFAGAALLLAGLAAIAIALTFLVFRGSDVVFNPFGGIALPLGLAGVAAAIGIAVLRYHLYDIDVFLRRALLYAALVTLIGFGYLALVVTIGTRITPSTLTDRAIPFVVAAVVAIVFQPLRARLHRLAARLAYGKRASPYEVLAAFSRQVSELYAEEDLTSRMARVLAEGSEADRAEVWLRVGDNLLLAAASPRTDANTATLPLVSGEPPAIPGAAAAVPVRYQGELLGMLAVVKREDITPIEARLVSDLAHEAALILKNERLAAELSQRLQELTVSRQRLVTAQDAERRRIERNLHDGAQQDLVALKLKLAAAKGTAESDPRHTRQLLEGLVTDVGNAVQNLRELARGIYPPILADSGLAAALEAQAARSPLRVEVHAGSISRYPPETEAAVYFCCLEALQNAVKHAKATVLTIDLEESAGMLRFRVADNGQGIDMAKAGGGSGIQNMTDRVAALGGSLEVGARPGGGTLISGQLPAAVPARREPALRVALPQPAGAGTSEHGGADG
jgi:signal transduction histidine kinase